MSGGKQPFELTIDDFPLTIPRTVSDFKIDKIHSIRHRQKSMVNLVRVGVDEAKFNMLLTKLRFLPILIILGVILSHPPLNFAQEISHKLNLTQTIEAAIKANLRLQQSRDEVEAAQSTKKARTTDFLPTLNARYGYIRRDEPSTQALGLPGVGVTDVLTNPQDEYNFVTSFNQPIFTGFALLNQYKIASLGLDVAK